MRLLKICLLSLPFIFFIGNAFAELSNGKRHQNWFSGLTYTDGKSYSVILAKDSINKAFFVVDFYNYIPSVTMPKSTPGVIATPIPTSCSLRIDNRTIYKPRCLLSATNETYSVLMQFLESSFYDDCMQGQTLRVRLEEGGNSVVIKFDLSGFTSAYRRAKKLSNQDIRYNNDESYFY